MTHRFDVVVMGGGPGGYATALRAAGHGLRVAVVEADRLGGTCLHRGCVPSKALLHVARLADAVPQLVELGLAAPGPTFDVAAAGRFRDGVVDRLRRGLDALVTARAVELVRGWGRVVASGVVEIDLAGVDEVRRLEADHLVIAVGSAPLDLPGVEPDGSRVMRSDDVLRLDRVPAKAAVVGGGAVGVELASLWRSLGAEVTIVEALDRLLPTEDPDTSTALVHAFARRGIDVRTGTALAGVTVGSGDVTIALAGGDAIVADQVLVAVGRRPATGGCGLDQLGVLDDQGYVGVDALGQTAVDGVWAVGDAIRGPALAHAAFAEGFVVADAIAGLGSEPVDHQLIPRVTYCSPEVASVGWTEPEARSRHEGVQATTVPLTGNARSLIEGTGGQVKLVTATDGTLLGAHVIGPSATEMIGELGLATTWEALASELGEVVHAHPTLSEALREAALAAAGKPFHIHA